ncbi:hypothetical protein [Burkholderia vietnamiensis]|uniref:hypothetical protein n=1 Tax=Burkholderia vietnamiensis TaxID=60552 RepID=UPI00159499A9|nr:hypothetical protein [Burkholderia vietnamiensis]MCA8390773.1 hypothetical protein [Burkholderia vietnamiensis]MDN7816753.1 hypothetical protein [Burkholderia vietnamiensis]CAG9196908.1 conserved hypothetical protein [Burkholderia vietnamiensis]HDR8956658.1 hypothetical protein [Burkholderia vietnamiensis]HDR9237731.1 hypothetical protein [Burkholderia vietnamiensis]
MDYPKSVPGVGLVDGKFVDENPGAGQVGSLIPSKWGNDLTDEVLNVLREAGINPDEATTTQLRDAVVAIAQRSVSGSIASQAEAEAGKDNTKLMTPLRVAQATAKKQDALGYAPVQQGTGIGQGPNIVKLGWAKDGSGVLVTVDNTDFGAIALAKQVVGYATQQWVQGYAVSIAAPRMSDRPVVGRDGWQADFALQNRRPGQNSTTYFRARDGGGLEIINNAYNSVPWNVSDGGETWQSGNLHVGDAVFRTDGNVLLPFRGAWLSDVLNDLYNRDNGKANAGARVQWDSGLAEFDYVGSVSSNIHGQIDLPAPWVVTGLRVAASTSAITAIWQRGVVLRNQ